jgi:hypothetical protein
MKSSFLVVLIFFLSVGLVLPCSASYSIRDVTITPLSDSYPSGRSLNTSAALPIIPAGPTTFIEGYTLKLSTDLDKAGWSVRVLVDGHQAAVFEKSGSTLFINGYLLSYPVTRDVEVRVTLEGTVPPPGTEGTFSVLRVVELNNQGQVVPESEQIVTRTIDVPATHPSLPPQSNSGTESPTTAATAGISPAPVIGGLFLIFFLALRRER